MNKIYSDTLSILGSNIYDMRHYLGKTIIGMSQYLDYNRNLLTKLENGTHNIKYFTLLHFAEIFDLNFPRLFEAGIISKAYEHHHSIYPYQCDNFLLTYMENYTFHIRQENIKHFQIYTKTGINEAYLSKLFSGKVDNPTIGTLATLAKAINMELNTLFSRRERY